MQNIIEAPMFAALIANPGALALYAYLSAKNGPEAKFMVADGLGEKLGWPRRHVPAARKALQQMGAIECVRPWGHGVAALYRWTLS